MFNSNKEMIVKSKNLKKKIFLYVVYFDQLTGDFKPFAGPNHLVVFWVVTYFLDKIKKKDGTLSQDVRPEVPHHPWRVTTEQGLQDVGPLSLIDW